MIQHGFELDPNRPVRPVAGRSKVVAAAAAALLLTACAAEPAPPLYASLAQMQSYGYEDRKLTDDTYEVTYLAPRRKVSFSRESRELQVRSAGRMAEDIALWRAADLALENGYPAFKVTDRRTDSEVTVRERDFYGFDCPFGFYRHRYRPFRYCGFDGFPERHADVQVTLTVDMKGAPGADTENAEDVRERLRKKYPGQQARPPAALPAEE